MARNPLVKEATKRLAEFGIKEPVLLRQRYDAESFGNAEAVFQIGGLIVRFVRDRSQDFVDLASVSNPEKFYQFDDMHIAMGWKSVDEIVGKQRPEPLHEVVGRLSQNLDEVEAAFSSSARLDRAATARREAFMARHGRGGKSRLD